MIPQNLLQKGPDALRRDPSAVAFVYTPYADDSGNHYFHINGGHEDIIVQSNVLKALFGPELDKVKDDFIQVVPNYENTPDGYVEKGTKVQVDYQEIRRKTLGTTLYGRYGNLIGYPVIMLWPPPSGWEEMLIKVLRIINMPENTIVTVGINTQFPVADLLKKNDLNKRVQSDVKSNSRYLDLLRQYHTATGEYKQYLKRALSSIVEPSTQRMQWKKVAQSAGVRGVFDYGESFKKFMSENEPECKS